MDRHRFQPFLTGLAMITVARRSAPAAFAWKRPPYEFERHRLPIDILCGTDGIRLAIERGDPLAHIERHWQRDLQTWKRRRTPALIYD
jgi:uncharacterized protein YbbC (DUF1343 family)